MGGGAGINFKMELGGFDVEFTGRGFKVAKGATVDKFHAEGYMDGMIDVSGRLLKVKDLTIDWSSSAEDAKWYKNEFGGRKGDILRCYFTRDGDEHPHYMAFGGWMRGSADSLMPMTLEGYYTLEFIGQVRVVLTVVAADKEEFKAWYSDIFDFCLTEDDLEEGDTLDDAYYRHFQDCNDNYGA